MNNLTCVIIFLFASINAFSQDLPEGFEEKIKKEFLNISEEVRQNELQLTFEQYLENRTLSYLNKQQFYSSISGTRSVNNLCDNGTFESGDVNLGDWNFYWEGAAGSWSPVTYTSNSGTNRMNTGSFIAADHHLSVHHQAVSLGPDPTAPSLSKVWSFPVGNSKSLRLGNKGVKYGKESVAKVITVTNSNKMLTFSYAMVVQNPGHGVNQDPSFRLNIIDATNPANNYNNLVHLGGLGINYITSSHPLLKTHHGDIRYKDWACVSVDLSSLIGKTIIIEFENRDCWAGGHWGYSYLDNICLSCDGANGDEGSIKIDQGQSSDCEIPGQICIDFSLPNGTNPSLDLELQIIQNGTIVATLNSPTLSTGNSYCFNLTSSNTSGLNVFLLGFDYKVIGRPKLNGFSLSPKIIGSSTDGIINGVNNDYDIYCPLDCCKTPLKIVPSGITYVDNKTISGIELSTTVQSFKIDSDSKIPITEFRVSLLDMHWDYNYDDCAKCIDNPALWSSIETPTSHIGNAATGLKKNGPKLDPYYNYDLLKGDGNLREMIWSNPNGSMLKKGDHFDISYWMPPLSEIPCCTRNISVCQRFSWKDANCALCDTIICSNIQPQLDFSIEIEVEKNGCCERVLTANSDAPTSFLWNTGETIKQITVTQNGTYTVTATLGGNSVTKTILVTDIMSGAFPLLSFNSLFHPDFVPPYKNKFYIMDISPDKVNEGIPNSYNANEYKLEIWHRWNTHEGQGNPLKVITGTSSECNGFNNWDIFWDGTDQSGVSLKDEKTDSYVWRLTLKNCTNESSRLTYRTTWDPKCGNCIKWKKFLWWTWCAEYEGCWNIENFEYGDVQMTR